MITPSTSVCGLAIISGMSLQVPGSDSSALTTRYFGFGLSCGMKPHFMPVGKPAPPRPRRPESLTAVMTSSGLHRRAPCRARRSRRATRRSRSVQAALGVPVVGEDRGQRVESRRSPSSCFVSVSARAGVGLLDRHSVLRARPVRRGRGRSASARRARSSRARGRSRARPGWPARRPGPRRRGRRGSRRAPARPRARCTSRGPRVEWTSLPARRSSTSCGRPTPGSVVHELPVDHHHRRVVAGRVALDVLEGDLAVLGGLVVADVEVVLEPLEDRVAAHHRAQRVGADADVVVADRPALVHRVERRDAAHLGGGDVEDLGAGLDALRRDPALDGLHQVQHRQQPGARLGVAGRDLRAARPSVLLVEVVTGRRLPSRGRWRRSRRSRRRPCRPRSSRSWPAGW